MKKMLLPFLGILLLAGCEKEAATPIDGETDTALDFRSKKDKVNVCHYSEEDDSWHVINVSQNALAAHQAHGDAVDMDGDGFFDRENGCSDVDCDGDTEYNPDNSCVCVEGELKVTLDDGTIRYVHPEDQATGGPFSVGVNWSNAQTACANLAEETGCDWYLPTIEELGAIYQQLFVDQGGIWYADASDPTGGYAVAGNTGFNGFYYWSSSEGNSGSALSYDFQGSGQFNLIKASNGAGCRCVRR